MKDLWKATFIRWNAEELLRVAARHYRAFLELNDDKFFRKTTEFDIRSRQGLWHFWNTILPQCIQNSLGCHEHSAAYILRHTQLLPRQILYYFNQIAIINYEANGGWRTFDHASVVKGVEQAENLICEEVFSAFGAVYPMAKELCEYVLPRFQPIMKYGDLHRIWNNCNTDGMGDKRTFPEFLKMLFDMGVMGEVIVGQNVMRDRPYIEGRFQCNSEGRIVVSEAANLCVHPIFSKFFNVRREAGEKRAVYPYGCELEQLPWPTDQLLGHVAAL